MSGLYTAIASTVISGVGMWKNFNQAAKQRRKASQAERDSEALMARARSQMQKDAIQNLKLPLESYERSFRANTAQQRQAIDALQGADARTLAGGIGKVGLLAEERNEAERIRMGEDLFSLGVTKAESANKVRDELVGMDVGAARDKMTMAGDLREASAASTSAGVQAGISGAQALASAIPTFTKGAADRRAAKLYNEGSLDPTKISQVPEMKLDNNPNSPTYGQQIPSKEIYYPNAPLEGEAGYIPISERADMTETDVGYIAPKSRPLMRARTDQEIKDILSKQGYTAKQIKEMLKDDYDWSAFDYSIFDKKYN